MLGSESSDILTHHIEDALSSMFSHGRSLEKCQQASARKMLLQKIEFVPLKGSSCPSKSLYDKYVQQAKPGVQDYEKSKETAKRASTTVQKSESVSDGISAPSRVLYSPDDVELSWPSGRRVGAGLCNLGNTCFLNATLQCLTYTAPLVNYLQKSNHMKTCRVTGFCMMCELQKHISQCFSTVQSAIKPVSILQKLRLIARHMKWGRQEDAHEFLRYVVDALQRASLVGYQGLDQRSKETTAVNQIFGGYLRSQVTCLKCHENSNTFDPFLDLSMDVKGVNSVEMALQHFVKADILAKDNAYFCARCKCKVTARKAFTIHRAPNVLTIQLKRYGVHGGKVTRHISFSELLNLRPFMSTSTSTDKVLYRLYAVLVHDGSSTNSGHYYCYVRTPGAAGAWHCMNDSSVHPTSIHRILQAEAYILFYIREGKQKPLQNGDAHKIAANGFVTSKLSPGQSSVPADGMHKLSLNDASRLGESKQNASESRNIHRSKSEPCLQSAVRKNLPSVIVETPSSNGSKKGVLVPSRKSTDSHQNCTSVVNGGIQASNSLNGHSAIHKHPVGSTIPCNGHVAKPSPVSVSNALQPKLSNGNLDTLENTKHGNLLTDKCASQPADLSTTHHVKQQVCDDDNHSTKGSAGLLNGFAKGKVKVMESCTKLKHAHAKTGRSRASLDSAVSSTTKWRVSVALPCKPRSKPGVLATTPWKVCEPVPNGNLPTRNVIEGQPKAILESNIKCSPPECRDGIVRGGSKQVMNGLKKASDSSSLSDNETVVVPKAKRLVTNGLVQHWDQLLPKGYRSAGLQRDVSKSSQPKWDGSCSRNADVVQELEMNGIGYGVEVNSWDGGPSVMTEYVANDRKRAASSLYDDEYDEELDRGRVKKVKKHHLNNQETDGINRFQQAQNFKIMEKEAKRTGIFSWKSMKS